jgi:hypothetical protein
MHISSMMFYNKGYIWISDAEARLIAIFEKKVIYVWHQSNHVAPEMLQVGDKGTIRNNLKRNEQLTVFVFMNNQIF